MEIENFSSQNKIKGKYLLLNILEPQLFNKPLFPQYKKPSDFK